jgi:phosphoserine phosphatase
MRIANITNLYGIVNSLPLQKDSFAVFDFDNTCITNDIEEAVFAYICENDLIKNRNLLSSQKTYCETVFHTYYHLIEKKKIQEAYIFIAKVFSGFSVDEISLLVTHTLKKEGNIRKQKIVFGKMFNKGIAIHESIYQLLFLLIQKKIKIWVVSSSLEIIVTETIKKMHIFPKQITSIGMQTKIVKKTLTDTLIPPFPMYEGKVSCIKKYISQKEKPFLAVGDSENDQAMLDYAKFSYLFENFPKMH